MKPAWDQLGSEYASSSSVVVADVDCTVESDLCSEYDVRGYPTIKYFKPDSDEKGTDYSGGRTFDDLKKFASENLGPQCGPGENIELCSAEVKAKIEGYMKMSVDRMSGRVHRNLDSPTKLGRDCSRLG